MMELATIVPPPWTGLYPQGNYRMALAHWVLANPKYAERVRSQKAYTLLDNGAFEGSQLTLVELNEAIAQVGADEVVLPDVLGNPGETLRRSWDALGKLATHRVMFVPQGRTDEEWRKCLNAWLRRWRASTWSESYALSLGLTNLQQAEGTKPQLGTRVTLLDVAVETGLPVHLLGVGSMREFARTELPKAYSLGVRGVDTSSAFAMAANPAGRQLLTRATPKVRLGSPEDYETLSTGARRLVHLNIRILSAWIDVGVATEGIPTYTIRQVASMWEAYFAEGFAELADMMRTCGMPSGRYALLKENGREKYVRLLEGVDQPRGKETLIVLEEL